MSEAKAVCEKIMEQLRERESHYRKRWWDEDNTVDYGRTVAFTEAIYIVREVMEELERV